MPGRKVADFTLESVADLGWNMQPSIARNDAPSADPQTLGPSRVHVAAQSSCVFRERIGKIIRQTYLLETRCTKTSEL